MRYYQRIIISDELLNDMPFIKSEIANELSYNIKDFAKKGLKIIGAAEVRIGKDNDSFVQNVSIVMAMGHYERAPRICLKRDYKRKRFTLKMIFGKNYRKR